MIWWIVAVWVGLMFAVGCLLYMANDEEDSESSTKLEEEKR